LVKPISNRQLILQEKVKKAKEIFINLHHLPFGQNI